MAKSRRGRLPLPRGREAFFSGSHISEKKYRANFGVFIAAFHSAKTLKRNEAVNMARYILNLFDLGETQTSIEYEGEAYDYSVFVMIDGATLELQQSRAIPLKMAA